MPIGAHVGVADGYAAAIDYAVSVGCECIQVFAKSPRRWVAAPVDPVRAGEFRAAREAAPISSVLVHTAYLINLGSADDALWERSWRALADELGRARTLGAEFVVTHTGTEYRSDPASTALRIATAVDLAWMQAEVTGPRLLLENTAAAGTTFGDGPDELGAILSHLEASSGSVGVCLDTCHAHAAGWDLSQEDVWRDLLDRFADCCGSPIEAVHANDCAFPAGAHKDRHAWIGEGTIGLAGFEAMFRQPEVGAVPIVTEMPGAPPVKDAENITRLKRLRDASGGREPSGG